MKRVGRLTISLRLTLAFCVAMAAVLLLVSTFVVALQRRTVDNAIRADLRQRYEDARDIDIRSADVAVDSDEGAAQLFDQGGSLRAGSAALSQRPLISPEQIEQGRRSVRTFDVPSPSHPGGRLRVLVGPARNGGVVVIATSLSPRNESLADLVQLLTAGSLVVLVAGGGLASWLARHALAPVERLRLQAAAISAVDADRALDVPDTSDEVSRLASTLNDLLGRLHESVDRERAFVADAGHELRTPLALLAGEIELALDAGSGCDHRETLLRLQRDVRRLITLAEDLLTMSRSAQASRRDVAVRPAIEAIVARLAPAGTSDAPRVVTRVDGDLSVHVDPGQFGRVITNLVENAHRHAGTDVEISAQRASNGNVEIQVRDFGDGFPDGFERVAFERFSRADASRTGPGSGLGLAIVEMIVREHGGTVRAANATSGRGAVVSVQLP